MDNPPVWWYLPGKMGIFMDYVSFREGNPPDFGLQTSFSKVYQFQGMVRLGGFGARWFRILEVPRSNNPFYKGIPGIQTTVHHPIYHYLKIERNVTQKNNPKSLRLGLMPHSFSLGVKPVRFFIQSARYRWIPVKPFKVPVHHSFSNSSKYSDTWHVSRKFSTRHAEMLPPANFSFSLFTFQRLSSFLPQGREGRVNQSDCESQRPRLNYLRQSS